MTQVGLLPGTTLHWQQRPLPGVEGALRLDSPGGSVLIHGLTTAEADFLACLQEPRLRSTVRSLGRAAGVAADRVADLLTGLRRAEVLMEAPRLGSVAVVGLGPVGLEVAQGLADAGVGAITLLDHDGVMRQDLRPDGFRVSDLGLPRPDAARRSLQQRAPGIPVRVTTDAPQDVDLVVVVGQPALTPHVIAPLMACDVVHLPVVMAPDGVCVGPVVTPGTDACLRCMSLHRTDADASWQARAAEAAQACVSPAIERLAAATAVSQAVARLSGAAPSHEAHSVRFSFPYAEPSLVRWHPHPQCGCTGAVSSTGPVSCTGRVSAVA